MNFRNISADHHEAKEEDSTVRLPSPPAKGLLFLPAFVSIFFTNAFPRAFCPIMFFSLKS